MASPTAPLYSESPHTHQQSRSSPKPILWGFEGRLHCIGWLSDSPGDWLNLQTPLLPRDLGDRTESSSPLIIRLVLLAIKPPSSGVSFINIIKHTQRTSLSLSPLGEAKVLRALCHKGKTKICIYFKSQYHSKEPCNTLIRLTPWTYWTTLRSLLSEKLLTVHACLCDTTEVHITYKAFQPEENGPEINPASRSSYKFPGNREDRATN